MNACSNQFSHWKARLVAVGDRMVLHPPHSYLPHLICVITFIDERVKVAYCLYRLIIGGLRLRYGGCENGTIYHETGRCLGLAQRDAALPHYSGQTWGFL